MSYELVDKAMAELDLGDEDTLNNICNTLLENGYIRNAHVGNADIKGQEALEWFAGQIIDIALNKAYFAVNSILNWWSLHKFEILYWIKFKVHLDDKNIVVLDLV